MNKPHFSEQISVTPRTQVQRAQAQQALAEKVANASPAPRKKSGPVPREKTAAAATIVKKVKPPEIPLNPRDAAVRDLLLASQKQAQHEASLINNTQKPGMREDWAYTG
jgi:hypothetical protein